MLPRGLQATRRFELRLFFPHFAESPDSAWLKDDATRGKFIIQRIVGFAKLGAAPALLAGVRLGVESKRLEEASTMLIKPDAAFRRVTAKRRPAPARTANSVLSVGFQIAAGRTRNARCGGRAPRPALSGFKQPASAAGLWSACFVFPVWWNVSAAKSKAAELMAFASTIAIRSSCSPDMPRYAKAAPNSEAAEK